MGYWGVDIFVFLSAYGLYFSFQKKGYTIRQFYKRRVFRLLPAYYIALIFISFTDSFLGENSNSFLVFLQKASMLGFFLPFLHWPFFLWYIPGILLLYALFPLLYKQRKLLEKPLFFLGFCIGIIILHFLLIHLFTEYDFSKYGILMIIPRIIVFFFGLVWADSEKSYIPFLVKRKSVAFFVALGILCLFLWLFLKSRILDYYPNLYIPEVVFVVLALPGIISIFIFIYKSIPVPLKKIFNFMGLYSLELYLVHQDLYRYGIYFADCFNLNKTVLLYFMFILSFFFAYFLKKIVNFLFNFA